MSLKHSRATTGFFNGILHSFGFEPLITFLTNNKKKETERLNEDWQNIVGDSDAAIEREAIEKNKDNGRR